MLTISVAPGLAVAFEATLSVEPNEQDIRQSLVRSSLVLAARNEDATDPQDILAAAQADYGRLVSALNQLGYFGPVVSILVDGREAASIPPLSELPAVSGIQIHVSTGPLFRFGSARIEPLPPGAAIPETFSEGMPAKLSVVRDATLAAVDGWRKLGYAKARVAHQEIIANHAQARLQAHLELMPGPLVRFGELEIADDSMVREDRIRAIAGIPSGGVFDPVELESASDRLRRTGAFNSVSIQEKDRLGPGDTIDLELSLVDAKAHRYGIGAEMQSSQGLTVSSFWMNRNLLGGAERLRIGGEISGLGGETGGLDYHLNATLSRPSTFGTLTDLVVFGELVQLDEPIFFSRQANTELSINHHFSGSLTAEVGVAYRSADVRDDLGSRRFSYAALPISAIWDRRDDPLNPSKGIYLRGDVMPFYDPARSAASVRTYLDTRMYRKIGFGNGTVLAGRLQYGSLNGSTISETPPDLLFFAGGSGTVRGHPYQSLSISSGGIETGGRSLLGFAGEVRIMVTDTIEAVGFYDLGYVGANGRYDDTGGWQSGAGVGVRYHTGIGPIRLDIAAPVSGSGDAGVQIYFGLGQTF